jgi:hypothetical protein
MSSGYQVMRDFGDANTNDNNRLGGRCLVAP